MTQTQYLNATTFHQIWEHLPFHLIILCGTFLLLILGSLLGVRFLQLVDPEVGELAVLVALEPRPAGGVVDGLGRGVVGIGGVDLVVPDEEVPYEGDLADLGIVEPHEAVEEGAGLGANGVGGEGGDVLAVGAVIEDEGGPVFAGVNGLDGAVHLGGLGRGVVVVDAHDGEAGVTEGEESGGVVQEEEVAVDEEGPAAVAGEVGGEEAGEGELGALGGAAGSPVEAGGAEVGLSDGVDGQGHGGAAEERAAADLVGHVLTGVVTDEHTEGLLSGHVGELGAHACRGKRGNQTKCGK
ncbi:unnamed protein product [Musa acuminata subsp. malaccensis]|uniref:(wild Malaysian banana) hypothetical protein n=1 Tax=Musa acuminata subsp. malaccensis TaxID=214687 RepID=A0A8D7FP42_MUSAM|nr:unnamed protein product [Musa acuminata subsp. malaccensis]